MATIVLILGESGTGKSASLRNFKPDDVGIINVAKKPLPFRNQLKTFNSDSYSDIKAVISKCKAKSIVIDDAQYLLAYEYMRTAAVKGYEKFTAMAENYWSLVQTAVNLPDDKIVYFLQHTQRSDDGTERAKTIGRMLDEKITVEGMFTIVLKTVVKDGKYFFSTQNSGFDTVKAPIGMFDSDLIDNDLAAVDAVIRSYYA